MNWISLLQSNFDRPLNLTLAAENRNAVGRRLKSVGRTSVSHLILAASLAVMMPAWGAKGGGSGGTGLKNPDIVRFLEQATFGPTLDLVNTVQGIGFNTWLEQQRAAPASRFPDLQAFPSSSSVGCPADDPGTSPTCYRDNYTMYPLQVQFFKNALGEPDQLRQRVAFALSQIFVVSGLQIQQPSSMVPFLNILVDNAFGNYRDLLQAVTLNPAMGDYLDMVNNDKPNLAGTIQPNENYAREVLQLFSIGLYALNSDGTFKTDPNGYPIPAYDQEIIEGFAHAFTGWTYATLDGATPKAHNPRNYLAPMWLYRNASGIDTNHDKGEKRLLDYPGAPGAVLASNQDGEADLQQALDNIFNHPNVGPFISRLLIQNLVTSNPSPSYVKRVAAVFDNNGSGVRGDLYATVKSILLDREARGLSRRETDYGHLREPVLFVANLLRALNATSDGIVSDQAKAMGQNLFYSSSVFNYYPHDFMVPGTSIQGPEFGIETSSAAIARANFVNTITFSKIQPKNELGTSIDLSGLEALASTPSLLVDWLDSLLMHSSMSSEMKALIIDAVNTVPDTNPRLRAQTAFYLVATSSQYLIQR